MMGKKQSPKYLADLLNSKVVVLTEKPAVPTQCY